MESIESIALHPFSVKKLVDTPEMESMIEWQTRKVICAPFSLLDGAAGEIDLYLIFSN